MNLKKILLLVTAILCLAALAAPAAASAKAVWTDKGEFLGVGKFNGLNGTMGFQAGFGGITCEVDVILEFEKSPSETGMVFEIVPLACEGKGLLAGCEVPLSGGIGMPWTIHAETDTTIKITNVLMGYGLKKCGGIEEIILSAEKGVTATPDNSAAITTLALTGAGNITIGGGIPMPVEVVGLLTYLENERETYGILAQE